MSGGYQKPNPICQKPNPICATCKKEMVCMRNGVTVVTGGEQWRGDLYQCSVCGSAVVATFGMGEDAAGPWGDNVIHFENL